MRDTVLIVSIRSKSDQPCVFIVDDDYAVRDSLGLLMEVAGFTFLAFESAEDFLKAYEPDRRCCLLLDVNMPGMSGLDLQAELNQRNYHLPIIFLSGYADVTTKELAIRAGAVDFFEKPVSSKLLLDRIQSLFPH